MGNYTEKNMSSEFITQLTICRPKSTYTLTCEGSLMQRETSNYNEQRERGREKLIYREKIKNTKNLREKKREGRNMKI
jgi:hypothetical protein